MGATAFLCLVASHLSLVASSALPGIWTLAWGWGFLGDHRWLLRFLHDLADPRWSPSTSSSPLSSSPGGAPIILLPLWLHFCVCLGFAKQKHSHH